MKNSGIINLVTSRSAKHLTLVFTGNIAAAGLGFLAVLLISRELSVSDFGLFNMSISIMLITSALSSLGMDITMVKFASSYLAVQKTAEADQVLRATLHVSVTISLIFAVITFSTAELVSTKVFHYPGLTPLIKLASVGILGVAIKNYIRPALHAHQLFRESIILQLLIDFGKFTAVTGLIIFSLKMDVFTAVAIFALVPFLGVIPGLVQFGGNLFSREKPVKNLFSRLLSYSKWIFAGRVCTITYPFVGILMLAKMLSSEAAGIYGLALNLTYIFPILISSLSSVLLPKVSRFREIKQFKNYMGSSLRISSYMGISVIPFLLVSHKIIPFFFGLRYLDSIPVFNWLLLSAVVFTINSTVRVAILSMNKSHIAAAADLIRLFTMILGCYLLIPFLNVLAPAVLSLVINTANLIFFSTYVFRQKHMDDIIFQEEEVIEDIT